MDNITRADPDRVWTVREVAEHVGIGGIGPVIVGTPEKVADEIEAWFEATDVDGLNIAFAVSPGDFEDISDMLVPELTRRGRYKTAYAEGTLREKLFGKGRARLDRAASGRAVPAAGEREGGGVICPSPRSASKPQAVLRARDSTSRRRHPVVMGRVSHGPRDRHCDQFTELSTPPRSVWRRAA